MTGLYANLRRSFRELEDDLERAGADLAVAVDRAIPGTDIDDFITREEGEPTIVKVGELQEFLDNLDDTSAEIDFIVEDFNRRVVEALKVFKQQVLTEATTKSTS